MIALAWGVHLFTATGAVLALLALLAIERGQSEMALFWLFVALVIDGVDGMLARAAKVRERVQRIDGDALDLVVDYLTYVLVPVWFMLRGGYLPVGVELSLGAAILVSSLYVFARRDMKTDDGYFRGFPALWNVVAFYFFVLRPTGTDNAAVVMAFVLMTFAPVHVVHPFRTRDYGALPAVLAVAWTASTAALLLPLEQPFRSILMWVSLASAGLLIALGLVRTVRGKRRG